MTTCSFELDGDKCKAFLSHWSFEEEDEPCFYCAFYINQVLEDED